MLIIVMAKTLALSFYDRDYYMALSYHEKHKLVYGLSGQENMKIYFYILSILSYY